MYMYPFVGAQLVELAYCKIRHIMELPDGEPVSAG